MPFDKMKRTSQDAEDGFTVTIEHDVRQSYSRAVDPAAVRYANAVAPMYVDRGRGRVVAVTLTGTEYGASCEGLPENRCRAVYTFVIEYAR